MKRKLLSITGFMMILALVLTACGSPTTQPAAPTSTAPVPTALTPTIPAPTATARPTATPALLPTPILLQAGGEQPVKVSGEFTFTNDFVLRTYYVEQAVALVDMHGFVTRNKDWEIPLAGQVIGYMEVDKDKNHGTFFLDLPARPEGTFNDVSHSGQGQVGVQIFCVSYWPNLYGGPFAEGDDRSRGWPAYLASVKTDSENKDEVTGGKLVVWAPDDKEEFPTGFGTDGLLFTADDPLGPLPAGYSVIDLDQKPFAINRKAEETATLFEPQDIAIKDYTTLSYSAAFEQMFNTLKKEYAFNGFPDKQPNWDQAYADVAPKVKEAESKKDPTLYFEALQDFTLYFKDGHVSIDGGDTGQAVLSQILTSGYGFAIRELDDGRAVVVYVNSAGAAAKAGIKTGAEVTAFNGTPIADAIGQVRLLSPESTITARRYEQARLLLRAPRGTQAKVTYQNTGGSSQTATLAATQETNSYYATSPFRNYRRNTTPVEYTILDSGIGYIKINSNYDDLNLIVRLFERAMKTFSDAGLDGLILDLRDNSGGSSLGLAGFLTKNDILMGQLSYYSDKTGKFEPEGEPEKFTPNAEQYHFAKMVLMVDMSCYSACELESYGFSKVPGMIVVGMYPSAGVEAETSRGDFHLPDGMNLTFPTGRFTNPDGSLFLEGQGVQPTVLVPVTAENVLSTNDVVLTEAVKQITK